MALTLQDYKKARTCAIIHEVVYTFVIVDYVREVTMTVM